MIELEKFHSKLFGNDQRFDLKFNKFFTVFYLFKPLFIVYFFLLNKIIKKQKVENLVFIFTKNQKQIWSSIRFEFEKEKNKIVDLNIKYYRLLSIIFGVCRNNFYERKKYLFINSIIDFYSEKIIANNIIHFNDHSPSNVHIFNIADQKKINSIYIQHAGVNNKFPPLYNHKNYLFDNISFNIYKENGILNTVKEVKLIGYPFLKLKLNIERKKQIVVAYGKYDSIKKIKKLAFILNKKGYNYVIKPHPALYSKHRKKLKGLNITNLDNSILYQSSEYLITCDSYSIIEANHYGTKIIIFEKISDKFRDNYHFLKLGNIKHVCNNYECLFNCLSKQKSNFKIYA